MSIRDQALRASLAGVDLTLEQAHSLGAVPSPVVPSLDYDELASECPSIGWGLWPLNAGDTTEPPSIRDDH